MPRFSFAAVLLPLATSATALPGQGGAVPQVSVVGVGCGSVPSSLTMSPPLSGEVCRFAIEPVPASTFAVLFWSLEAAAPILLPGGCQAYVDPATVSLVDIAQPVPGTSGQNTIDVLLPPDPNWLGVPLAAQAATLPSAAVLGFDTSNGVEFAVGQRQGPLASLPSPPGTHLVTIATLSADSWLDLGEPAADPVYGRATGREYTPRMAWSTTLQGAFLTGESGHGYVHPQTGRYIDDVWFYDFAAHRWLCVKPGSEVASLSLTLNADQFEVDGQGDLVPTAQLGHGYGFVAFDEQSQRFLMQPAPNTYWTASMPQRLGWLPSANFPASQYRSPWLFDSITGKWLRELPGPTVPTFNVSGRGMAVLGMPHGLFFYFDTSPANQNRVWWFDPIAYAWQDEATMTPAPAVVGHGVICYDPNHARVWYYGVDAALQQAKLWFYDVALRQWQDSFAANTPQHSVVYTTANRGLSYDEVADVVLLKVMAGGTTPPSFHPFDVASNSWQAPITPPANLNVAWNYRHINVCFASGHNVHVLHVSGGNSATGRIVVYRRGV